MIGSSHGGKGSSPRPISNKEQFDKNWDLIFGNNKNNENAKSEGDKTPLVDIPRRDS